MSISKLLIYSNKEDEIDEYGRLVSQEDLPLKITICRNLDDLKNKITEADATYLLICDLTHG